MIAQEKNRTGRMVQITEGETYVGSTASPLSTAQESAEAGIESLWSDFKRTGEQSLRNQLIIYYSPFVKYIAGRVLAGLPRHFDEEDLVSYGIIGLIDAIERFELDRNLRFETYAIPRIKGAIIDELRSIDWVPRSVRTKARAVEQAFTHLEGTLRRTPNEAEVAAELEMSVGDFHKALRKISTVGMMALDEVLRGGDRSERSTLGETLPDGSWGPVDTFEAKESKEALVSAVDGMPERERTVLMMYYYDGLTLTEIGQVLGVTESRVCQIHTKALRQLRSKLADRPESVRVTPVPVAAVAPAAPGCNCWPASDSHTFRICPAALWPPDSRVEGRQPCLWTLEEGYGAGVRPRASPRGRVMPLHKRETIRDQLIDSVYADQGLKAPLPATHCPDDEMRPADVMRAISDELLLDGNARQNLATFCQTWEEPEVHQLMDLCIDKNLIDKDEYPQTAELERRCVRMLAGLWNAPDGGEPVGCSAIGSSEACMLGGMAAKWRWRAKREAAGKPTDKPNMVCGPVQVVWHKFARYWDIEMREIPMSPGRYFMDVDEMLAQVDENTIMVVPTFGVTYTGSYEPVLELSKALDKLQEDTGLDVDIHVDGASGAFLAPFCAPDIVWDFRAPRVKSISTSGHKFGLAPLGVGWVLWRDAAELPDDLIFHVTYLGGDMPVFQINFSRPAGQIVAQYYNFVRLGKDGYRNVHTAC